MADKVGEEEQEKGSFVDVWEMGPCVCDSLNETVVGECPDSNQQKQITIGNSSDGDKHIVSRVWWRTHCNHHMEEEKDTEAFGGLPRSIL